MKFAEISRSVIRNVAAGLALSCFMAGSVYGADINITPDVLDPTPIITQQPAVDGLNFKASALTGVIGGYANHMVLLSASTPFPYFSQFGAQLDLGIGNYRSDYTSAAAGLHLFWRDPSVGMLGIYGDYGYVNPEHAGRMGFEGSLYNGRWTLDGFAGVQFGQHVLTQFVDEVDLTYYFTDEFRGSIGQRYTSRGNVGNVSFEYMPASFGGWSVFGEAEAGEDHYYGAWLGIRYSFGTGGANSLIERDRASGVRVRIPRNIASVTQCGDIPDPANYHKAWNGFKTEYTPNLCASEDEIHSYGATVSKN